LISAIIKKIIKPNHYYEVSMNKKTNQKFNTISMLTAAFVILIAALFVPLPFGKMASASVFAAGDLDTSFGNGGKVTTPIGATIDFLDALAVQPDGKIIAVGGSFNGLDYDFAVVRYNENGTLDTSFGIGGKVTTPVGTNTTDGAADVALQPDGKIVVAGGSGMFSGGGNFGLVRYNADGSLDTSFGTGGKVVTPVVGQGSDNASAVAILPGGKILAAGVASSNYALVRYNPDGTLDTSFGTGGKIITNHGSGGNLLGMTLQPDNKIVERSRSF
jgi:uncharacterized delta-60 repeat protein